MAYTRNQKDRASLAMPHNDRALWHLINLGVQDMPTIDKLWDASTHSMRFATCLADCLWVMLDTLGARAPIISGHMLNTLRIQSTSDHNVSSGQRSDTFKMYPVM